MLSAHTRTVATVHLLLLSSTGLPRRLAASALPVAKKGAVYSSTCLKRAAASAAQCLVSSSSGISSSSHGSRQQRSMTTAAAAAGAGSTGELQIERVRCLSDNYSWLLHEPQQNVTAVVDPAEISPVVDALRAKGWTLTHIINTHHHWDHVGANEALKTQFSCTVVGPAADAARIPGIDVQLKDGDRYQLGDAEFVCYDTPGHTRGHVTYFFPASKALFPGDTLFSLGCGRLFEGTPAQMWASLSKLTPLPQDTRVFCAHEYTQSNTKFALHVDPENTDLQRMAEEITAKRQRQEPTVPSLLADELKCNPFLRPDSPAIRERLGVPAGASDAEAFGAIRSAKDSFR